MNEPPDIPTTSPLRYLYVRHPDMAPRLHVATPDQAGLALCGATGTRWMPPGDRDSWAPESCTVCATRSLPWYATPLIIAAVLPRVHPSGDAAYAQHIQTNLNIRNINKSNRQPNAAYAVALRLSSYGTPAAYAQYYGLVRGHPGRDPAPIPQDDAARLARLTHWGQLYMRWVQQGLPVGDPRDVSHRSFFTFSHNRYSAFEWQVACGGKISLPYTWEAWLALLRAPTRVTCFRCLQQP